MFEYALEIEREVLDQKVGSDLFCRGVCQALRFLHGEPAAVRSPTAPYQVLQMFFFMLMATWRIYSKCNENMRRR